MDYKLLIIYLVGFLIVAIAANQIAKFFQKIKFSLITGLIIEPATAIVSLLDYFMHSPNATSLLLGMDEGQETMDIEILNKDMQGLRIRELRLPTEVIILAIRRKGQLLITHGYTRLRLDDALTLVGEEESLEQLKFNH